MRQVQLLPLLPHHALATEQRFRIRVPHVQPSAVSGPREAHNERADAEMRVHGVQKNDMSISDGAALAGVVALCVAKAQLSAGVFQEHCRSFVSCSVAILRPHLKLKGIFGDSRHRVNNALHRLVLA